MKNNLLAQVLLGLLGILLLLASIQMFGIGQGLSELEAEQFDEKQLNQLVDKVSDTAPDGKEKERQLEQIVALPLFSSTREPYVGPIIGIEPTIDEPVASPLDAKVSSIVITGDNSYVIIQDNVSKERLTLAQGMPLEGEQGLWTVANIEPRKVTFEAEGEEPVELELEVFSGSLGKAGGKKNKSKANNSRNNKQTQKITQEKNKNERANSAEAIRKKIAERRAQMRKEAADRNQKQ
ncbi:hypothetical protein [Marinicella rhabdoformis]|uniref:hypothetical protein n=1 Tax=Marinicella rhabdoformis TaxID=2580566 RepID=UPI0012AEDD1F|nr:hypothetical protein [Marinicella rhabdoformis]